MRRSAVVLLLAFVLGLAAAFGASCAGDGVKGGIPSSSAEELKAQIADVQEFVNRGDCDGIDGQLRQVTEAIDNLPASTDQRLVENLRQGADQLQSSAITACNERAQTQAQTQPQETVTETIPTETIPAPTTETTPPPTTATTPPPTETTPTQPTTPVPETGVSTTPPVNTTGGQGVQP